VAGAARYSVCPQVDRTKSCEGKHDRLDLVVHTTDSVD
jgi:hypothetical protein